MDETKRLTWLEFIGLADPARQAERRTRILARLREMAGPVDPESAHSEADQLLLELIDDPEISAAFEAIDKWYA